MTYRRQGAGELPFVNSIPEAFELFSQSDASKLQPQGSAISLDGYTKTASGPLHNVAELRRALQIVQPVRTPLGTDSIRVIQEGKPYVVAGSLIPGDNGKHYVTGIIEAKPASRYGATIVLPTGLIKKDESPQEAGLREFAREFAVRSVAAHELTRTLGVEEAPSQHRYFACNAVYVDLATPLDVLEMLIPEHEFVFRVAVELNAFVEAAQTGDHTEAGCSVWLLSAAAHSPVIGRAIYESWMRR